MLTTGQKHPKKRTHAHFGMIGPLLGRTCAQQRAARIPTSCCWISSREQQTGEARIGWNGSSKGRNFACWSPKIGSRSTDHHDTYAATIQRSYSSAGNTCSIQSTCPWQRENDHGASRKTIRSPHELRIHRHTSATNAKRARTALRPRSCAVGDHRKHRHGALRSRCRRRIRWRHNPSRNGRHFCNRKADSSPRS